MSDGEIPGLTAGFKFEPDDEEVIEIFLVPRLRGEPLPLEDVIIDDDPLSAPPWKLFSRNGRDKANSAYFFTPGDATKSRNVRACAGVGTWVWQNLEKTEKLRIGDEIFAWQKVRFNFHLGSRRSGSTGWVMLEYSVVGPGDCTSFKICHISFTGHGQKRKRVPDDDYVDCDDDSAVTRHQLQVAATSSTATCNQDPTGDHQDQELFLMQTQDAGLDGPWIHQYQEQFATMQQQFVDQEQLPVVDLDGFDLPAVDHGMMPLHMDTETCHVSFAGHGQKRKRAPDGYVDCDDDSAVVSRHQLEVAATCSTATCYQDPNGDHQDQEHFLMQPQDAGVDGVTTGPWIHQYEEPFGAANMEQQFVDQEQLQLVDLESFDLPTMDHGMMPLHLDKETCVPEQFADYGRMPPPMDQDSGMPLEQFFFDDNDFPVLRQVLESLDDFATAAGIDGAFGDHWASAGHHVLQDHSLGEHQAL